MHTRNQPFCHKIVSWAPAAILTICGGSAALAQEFPRFDQVPIIATASTETFAQLFSRAHCSTVRGIILGDSQETCPLGLGSAYVPRLNFELFRRYGNAPETPLAGPCNHNGASPWADWLVRNSNAAPGIGASRLNPRQIPPMLLAGASSSTGGVNINNNQVYGGLYGLQHDAAHTSPDAQLPAGQEFFKRGTHVYMDVLAATNPDSGEVRARVTPALTPSPSYYQPTVSTLTTSMGLEQETFEIKRERLGPLLFNGREYMQVELSGSDPSKLTDIIGARFVSAQDDRGWALTSFGQGGTQTWQVLGEHPLSGPILSAIEPHVAIIAFGANDLATGATPREFHDNVGALVSFVRASAGEGLPIILLADPQREVLPQYRDNYDRLAGALHRLAMERPNVCAVNSRLLTEQAGWTLENLPAFLADEVHYNPNGAAAKARLEIEALYTSFAKRCHADLDDGGGAGVPDCAVDVADLLFFLSAFESGSIAADLDDDGDPAEPTPDDAVNINDLLYFLARFEMGC